MIDKDYESSDDCGIVKKMDDLAKKFEGIGERRCFLKEPCLFLYCILSVFLMEMLLKISVKKALTLPDIFFFFAYPAFYAVIIYFFSLFFKKRGRTVYLLLILFFLALIFSSQFLYYIIFKTFYIAYSVLRCLQLIQFWKLILKLIIENVIWIFLFFLPFIIFLMAGNRIIPSEKPKKIIVFLALFLIVILQLLEYILISGNPKIYSKKNPNYFSIERFGLMKGMKEDILGQMDFLYAKANIFHSQKRMIYDSSKYNVFDIDMDLLFSSEKDELLKKMHLYFLGSSPTPKNRFTGIFKGYNLVLITAESFSTYAIREDLTPTLYKLANEGFQFKNFYVPIWDVSTLDGEYVTLTGLLPKKGIWSLKKAAILDMPFVLGIQFKKLGYSVYAYHNNYYNFYDRHLIYTNFGYVYKALGNGLVLEVIWPESDVEMMKKTIPEYITNSSFHVYYLTVSGHLEYNFFGNEMAIKNKKYVENLPYSDSVKAYLATQIELDRALEYLLKKLEETGIAERTVIALCSDHYPYGLEKSRIDELAGHEVDENFELYKNTFILYVKGIKPITIDKPCSSLDILPTLLNLFGIEYDSRLIMGRDIFSYSSPLVVFKNRNFITDKGKYIYDSNSFTSWKNKEVETNYIEDLNRIIEDKFLYSAKILKLDYYRRLFMYKKDSYYTLKNLED